MTIGGALALIAVGAILKWAVTAHVSWIDLQTTGTVLFVIGLVGLVVALLYTFWWEPRRRDDQTRVVRQGPPPPPRA
jgi:heme/copper-type cytochrome/quinol oxidase subunit 2